MSDGNLNITGYVVNTDNNSDNIPDWIQLDHSKSYYSDNSYGTFYNDVIAKANTLGLNVGDLGTNVKLSIIYAGHVYRSNSSDKRSGLVPRAFGNTYIMGEQFAPYAPYNAEHPNRNFSHIGIHAHELGHLLGLPDLYNDFNNNGWWDLMAAGNFNGPTYSGACPAPINPQLRNEKGWITFQQISGDPTYQADYYLQDPEIFQIVNSSDVNNYFLVEFRKFNQTMTIGSTNCPDYNAYVPHGNQGQGILVWRRDHSLVSHGRIMHINGLKWPGENLGNAGDLLPGDRGVKVITPWSDLRTTSYTYNWIPNTTPSLNVGLELAYEGNSYYTMAFNSQHPENASPSYPKNVQSSWSGNNFQITWAANLEPDIASYKIWKYAEGSAMIVATVTNNSNNSTQSWIDYDVTRFPRFSNYHQFKYKVKAVDNTNKESIY